jgi:hypothetical protein
MNEELVTSENSAVRRHLVLVSVLLLLIIGPIFGPATEFLGERFGLETAIMLIFIAPGA